MIRTLLWRNTSSLRKKKLENAGKCLTGKLLSMVGSGTGWRRFTKSDHVMNEFQSYSLSMIVNINGLHVYFVTTVGSLNDEIDFIILFDDFDDEDYSVVFDKNSFSYKIISTNDLKTDSENDNEKVNMPLFPSPESTVSCIDVLYFFKDFENEFPAIVYNDALTSKLDLSTEPTLCPQHIDEFDLKDETSLSECDKEEQNVLYFNDLFPLNVIYTDDSKSNKDNDDEKINIKQSLGDNVMNTDVGRLATQWSISFWKQVMIHIIKFSKLEFLSRIKS
ncbi:hypothetical protein Tco_0803606 [Tanacetum coccineum]|uniref:Uncharacterized protein n=1 Tax=Tanacetum coccineum TaxID=301880 RepID=A0ABQ5A6F2_9ASTR